MITYFSWWYNQAVSGFWNAILIMTGKIYSFFSIHILVRTLFDPWKRDNYSVENASLQTGTKVILDNLISRIIGLLVRLSTMMFGFSITFIFFVLMLVVLFIWLALPIIILALIFNGTRMIING